MLSRYTGGALSDEEASRWISLRAIEWEMYPGQLSRAVAPLLFVWMPWWQLVLGVVVLNVLWMLVRHRWVSVTLAVLGTWLALTRWITVPVAVYLLIKQGSYWIAALALLWPILVALLSWPGKKGLIKMRFALKMGYVHAQDE